MPESSWWLGLDRQQLALVLQHRARTLRDTHTAAVQAWVVEHGVVTLLPAPASAPAYGSDFHRQGQG
jgi:hypothetical protein